MGPIPAILGGAFLLKSMFAIRGMTNEAAMVDQDLAAGSSEAARASLSRIVSRDVSDLDDSEIASATISSVAENVTDSVVGPLVAYGAFGLPGAAAYRAIDSIDSMIGYRGKYEHLGAAAARLDDAASFVPARLAGGAVVAAASALPGYDAPASAQTMIEQHGRTESPNGGWPIARWPAPSESKWKRPATTNWDRKANGRQPATLAGPTACLQARPSWL